MCRSNNSIRPCVAMWEVLCLGGCGGGGSRAVEHVGGQWQRCQRLVGVCGRGGRSGLGNAVGTSRERQVG
jgi:hypothetical protein